MTRPSVHKRSVEDEFLMLLMKLRMGLSNIDLVERFCVSESKVNKINLTWVNFVYNVISSLKIWPHRDIIIKHSPEEFIKKYPNTIAIVDAKSPVHNKSTDRVTVLTSPTQPLSLS